MPAWFFGKGLRVKSAWSDKDAKATIDRYARQGVNEDLALRVYTSRLLGRDPSLVLHGGGNTSVKTRVEDLTGRRAVDVLCVKGSGWDMAEIEPPGLPAVRLEPLRELIALERLSDEDMVNIQRGNLIDAGSPNPSIETLLHAFLPHKFVDHTHANAVLAVTDQADGEARCTEIYGDRVALVPYSIPGFDLAKSCAAVQAQHPGVEGLILLKHGIFSFGETAREAYERMIALVTLAEEHLGQGAPVTAAAGAKLKKTNSVAEVAPILRGLLAIPDDEAQGAYKRFVLEHRSGPAILDYVCGAEIGRYSQQGTVTPDHVIRTKRCPAILPAPEAGKLDAFAEAAAKVIEDYEADYAAYFMRNNPAGGDAKIALDPKPRVLLVPGLGLFAAAESSKSARITADLAAATVTVVGAAEAIGEFASLSEADLFDVEYWSLEQAKLGKGQEKPLARQVVSVTGGAGAIGRATATAFKAQGAEVALLDLGGEALREAVDVVGAPGIACDVTDDASVEAAFARIAETFGGLDILVSNAGAAWQGRIGDVDDKVLRQSFELNFFAHQRVAKAAVAIMLAQGTGGALLFNASKQAVNPGANFGPYGLPKAATMFLARQYAVDYGSDGIRSNAVNADRIRSGLLTDEMIAQRSEARGVSEADYMGGNLLGCEVTAQDVADAFVRLALSAKTTGAVLTVDGGNIAAALR